MFVHFWFILFILLPEVSLHAILLDHIHTPIVKSPHMKEEKRDLIKAKSSNDIFYAMHYNKVFIKLWRYSDF